MIDIVIPSQLAEQLERIAKERSVGTDAILEEAVQTSLRRIEREKIQQKVESFMTMHAELSERYLGQYVAVHNGEVVDHDDDFQALHERIRKRFGRQPVMIRRVESNPERAMTFRRIRFQSV